MNLLPPRAEANYDLYIRTGQCFAMPDRPDHICCPICHGTVFQPVVITRPNGSQVTTRFIFCANCTLVCLDPVALTRAFEDRPTARRPPTGHPATQAWVKINQRRRERE